MSPPTQPDRAAAKLAPAGPTVGPPARPATLARGTDRIVERPKLADERARLKAEAAKAKVKAKIEAAKAAQRARAAAEHARATAKADAKAKAKADAAKAKADAAKARAKAKLEQAHARAQAKADAAKVQPLDKGPPLGTPQPVTLITLFVPGVERDGTTAIDQGKWVEEALQCLARWFGRATAYAPGQGVYRDPTGSERREKSVPIQCYAPAKALKDSKRRAELAAFCRRMGQQTKQDEVGLVIGPHYHGIRIATR